MRIAMPLRSLKKRADAQRELDERTSAAVRTALSEGTALTPADLERRVTDQPG